jgi:signal transduction histidine kinase
MDKLNVASCFPLCLFLIFFFNAVSNAKPLVLKQGFSAVSAGKHLQYYEDQASQLAFDDVILKTFSPSEKDVLNFGITPATVWLKLEVCNQTNSPSIFLRLNQPILDEVVLYSHNPKSNRWTRERVSEEQPFYLRRFLTPEYLFELDLPKGETLLYYIKIKAKENIQIPLTLEDPHYLFKQTVEGNLAAGIYVGIMLVMLMYNFFIFWIFRDRSYLVYTAYILLILITQTSLQGLPFQFLWPNMPIFAVYGSFVFPALVGIAGLEFFKHFTHLHEKAPRAYRFSFLFYPSYILSVLLGIFGAYKSSFQLVEITASAVSIFLLVQAYRLYRSGLQEARFFLLGWTLFLVGICIYVLKDFEVLPYTTFTRYTMHFGSAVEVILLSFALADRINILKREKDASQAQALSVMMEKEKLIREQNVVLEGKVAERTHQLSEANQDLTHALDSLKEAQLQLVEAEKMASLGQLTAGIAHEINNPINFVSSSIGPLKQDIVELMEVVDDFSKVIEDSTDGKPHSVDAIQRFSKKAKDLDIGYLKEEVSALLSGIEDGAKRTADIVAGLQTFSRRDESDWKTSNIVDGLESTLILLRSSIPSFLTIERDYGSVPPIECLPGKLNQVFLNILNNSVQAVLATKTTSNHFIRISLNVRDEELDIRISDSGIGMNPEVKARIFEPFFTTKDVGEGTGLGMAIVFKILENHHGKIEIETSPGLGTSMCISLPIRQPQLQRDEKSD